MFFNPSFKDITQGKLGVWKGELEVKGQSGGRFSILVIGEQGSENIWSVISTKSQSNLGVTLTLIGKRRHGEATSLTLLLLCLKMGPTSQAP
jgi:hypothetical protein